MKVLLVNPEFPDSYWSGRYALPFVGRRSLIPPLALITVAALLPKSWTCRLADLNVEPIADADLRWADVVMLTGMLVQRPSLLRLLDRCRALGVETVVGGAYATALPEELAGIADHVVVGEAEEIVPVLAADLAARRGRPLYRETRKPDLAASPVPRFDLLKPGVYHQMALQSSRGCPFSCDFCDIIVMYGRRPRVKPPERVVAELEAIRATGFRGDLFFVDDNFVGNRPRAKRLLEAVAAWRRRTGAPFDFYTEASIDLADDPELIDGMVRAGFTAVFTGIETPSAEALAESGKAQNLRRDLSARVRVLLEKGVDVWAGFILGFDSDGPDAFDRMIEFVQKTGIPYAMVGMLSALPNTPLHRRLKEANRLRPGVSGDQFGLTNVITRMPATAMLAGYRRVLETLYEPEAYFQRCRENLAKWRRVPGAARRLAWSDLAGGLRALREQGIRGPYRRVYWKFLGWVAAHHPTKLGRAIAQAAAGHHYISYTRDVVVPSLIASAAGA